MEVETVIAINRLKERFLRRRYFIPVHATGIPEVV
jgi:hypothetical protein